MNPQLTAIILKELKEVSLRYLLNILVFLAIAFIAVESSPGPIQKLLMEFSFMVIPTFAMLLVGLPFIQEKFGNEKLLRKFEAILTTPTSLKTIWTGKMASIFLLSYPAVIIVIVTLLILWQVVTKLNPFSIISAPVWIVTFVIAPLIPMIYFGFSSWSVLRFTHPKIMQILLYVGIATGVLVYWTSGTLTKNFNFQQIINWPIITYAIIGIIACTALVLFLIDRLDKEKLIS